MAFQNPTQGQFTPTTYIWDVSDIQRSNLSPEQKELFIRLYQNLNRMQLALNDKDFGLYHTLETINGQMFFPNPAYNSSTPQYPTFRQDYRKVINFGALPNAGTTSVAHNITITPNTTFTRIYATASDTTGNNFIPIPYASTTDSAHNVELNLDGTNVNIITGTNRSNFNICYVVVEYLQT